MTHLKYQKDGSASVTRFSMYLHTMPTEEVKAVGAAQAKVMGLQFEKLNDGRVKCWVSVAGDASLDEVGNTLRAIFEGERGLKGYV